MIRDSDLLNILTLVYARDYSSGLMCATIRFDRVALSTINLGMCFLPPLPLPYDQYVFQVMVYFQSLGPY